ncbi:MAG: HAD family phosphatase [Elusimicrobiaceae bacterium]|nr:HAD family phosphatase [Elusimicrobiaceae bacterium]
MITHVIFDMDGTLFSTEPIYFECYRQAAKEQGVDFTFELFNECIGISTEEARPLMISYFGREVDIDEIYRGCCMRVDKYIAGKPIPVRPGAREAVEYFHKRGFKMGVATSNVRIWVEKILIKTGLRPYFSEIVTSDDVSNPKPDSEVYLRCAQKLGADVANCLVFEDSVAGATSAISAGMRTVVVPDLKQPDTFVRDHAFKIYQSLRDIYPDIDELLG